MSENEKNVPKRRFKEFENADDWEQRKVKDICDISTGKSNTQDRIEDGIYPFYVRSPIIERSNRYLYDEEAVLTVGDGVGTGKVYHYVNGKYDLHQRVYRMFDFRNGALPKYFYHHFSNHFYDRVMSMTAKTSVDSVRYKMISEMDIEMPLEKEQAKIIGYFDNLDNLIALHQGKLEKMKALKKAYLTEMFPAKGERKPKLRFAGFTDEWEQYKLGDLSESVEYGLNAAAMEFDEKNKYIRITDIDDESREFLNTNLTSPNIDLSRAENFKLQNGDIVFARTGASVGKSYIYKDSDGLVYYAGFLIRARIKPQYSAEFIFQNTLTAEYNKFIRITSQRSGQPGVNAQEYSEYALNVPKFEEQTKIGTFFRNIDDLITLHQHKLDKLQNIKKAYLNEMFI